MAVTAGSVLPEKFNWSKNPLLVQLHTDEDPASFVRIGIGVTITVNAVASTEFYQEQQIDSNGNVAFDISSIVDEYLDNNFSTPESIGMDTKAYVVQQAAELMIIWTQKVGTDAPTSNYVNSLNNGGNPYYVLQGGTSVESYDWLSWFYDKWKLNDGEEAYSPNPFLTWKPLKQLVDLNEVLPLYFLTDMSGKFPNAVWGVISVYNGDTIEETFITDASDSIDQRSILKVNPSLFAHLGVGVDINALRTSIIAGELTHYTFSLWITDSGDDTDYRVSEIRTFYFDESYRKNTNRFIYQNSLNGFDQIRFTGETEDKTDTERVTAAVTGISQNIPVGGLAKTQQIVEQYSIKMNTGILTKNETQALRELLLSARIYWHNAFEWNSEAEEFEFKFIQVLLTEKSRMLIKSSDYLNHQTIEFAYCHKNKVWTPVGAY